MSDSGKTQKELTEELERLRRRLAELESRGPDDRQAGEELRESLLRQRAILDNIPDMAWLKDRESRFIAVNGPFAEACGAAPADIVGRTDHDLWPRELADSYRADDAEVMRTGKRKRLEERLIGRDGRERWIETIKTPILDARGQLMGVTGIARDITERKRAEEELEMLKQSVDVHYDGAYWMDSENRFVYVNDAGCQALGYQREELIGKTVSDVNPRATPEAMRLVWERLRRDGFVSAESVHRRKDGSEFPVEIVSSYVHFGGREYNCGFARDITERKRAEQERLDLERRLLHAQKLESLGVLAGGIAHDFNNLLMAVLGNLDLALRKLSPISPARANIDQSARAARRATDLTRQLLAYSGRGQFVVKAMDLSELVEENAHLLRASVARTATLDLRLGRALPPIEGDAGQVQQVIMNLITNASEAIGDQAGVITVTTGVREWDADSLKRSRIEEVPPGGRYVSITVSDTGRGMDGQTQQRLFDPFFSTKAPGRGLGMSAILGIVRAHRGAVFVESAVGQGTTIRVLFPALEGAQALQDVALDAAAAAAWAPLLSGTVLVVDDEQIVRNVCQEMVESLGLRVLTAADGREAVEVFRRHGDAISHVILDLSMPNMDGMTAFKELARIRPGVKVILSSGHSEQDAIRRLSGQGLAGFIQKPYSLKNLRDALEKAV